MGVDLVIKYKDESIACPGRAYHYHTDGRVEKDYGKVHSQIEKVVASVKDKFIGYACYGAKDAAVITHTITEELEYLTDELVEIGQKLLLASLLEEDDIRVVEV